MEDAILFINICPTVSIQVWSCTIFPSILMVTPKWCLMLKTRFFMLVVGSSLSDRKLPRDKANISNPKSNRCVCVCCVCVLVVWCVCVCGVCVCVSNWAPSYCEVQRYESSNSFSSLTRFRPAWGSLMYIQVFKVVQFIKSTSLRWIPIKK